MKKKKFKLVDAILATVCIKCNPEMEKHKETYKKLCDEGSIQEFIDNERRDRFYYDYE